jgi:DNA polymerase III subunit gamma/tau
MAYQVLARKWRPQDFSSLVGQEPIVAALRNAVREGRVAQAYLFSGIRGVGKTTAARVLAKSLNCHRGPDADPCNECVSCLEITRGGSLDVIEVDAATYSKVEQVRELTESLKYGPARDRYKIVVLDEVHRLSRQAFDALLKIVEEPPPHLLFIFATTEIEAVPATILSRCQEFHFRRVSSLEVAALLSDICRSEGIVATDTALRFLARAGEGSVRDAVALLDQLATFGSGTITDEDAVRLLGGLDTALFHQLLGAILAGDPPGISALVRRVEEEGWDPRRVYEHFLAFCRDALHLAMGGDPGQIDLPSEEAIALAGIARKAGYENLLRLLNQLLTSESTVRRSEVGALAVEITWLRAAELPKLTRIEEILAVGTALPTAAQPAAAGQSRPALPTPPKAAETRAEPRPAPEERGPEPAAPTSAPKAQATAPPPRPQALRPGDPKGHAILLEEINKRRPSLAALLEDADIEQQENRLTIASPPGDTWLGGRLQQPSNRQVLDEVVPLILGPGVSWQVVEARAAAPAGREPVAVPVAPTVVENPTVQTILDIFGGTVERVEEPGPREDLT